MLNVSILPSYVAFACASLVAFAPTERPKEATVTGLITGGFLSRSLVMIPSLEFWSTVALIWSLWRFRRAYRTLPAAGAENPV